jgi:L-aminopeptidase/D-esterase-like protein
MARASETVSILSSLTNVEMPIFIAFSLSVGSGSRTLSTRRLFPAPNGGSKSQ